MEVVKKTNVFKAFKAADLLDMLECLRDTYRQDRLAIFLDNAGIHVAGVF